MVAVKIFSTAKMIQNLEFSLQNFKNNQVIEMKSIVKSSDP